MFLGGWMGGWMEVKGRFKDCLQQSKNDEIYVWIKQSEGGGIPELVASQPTNL
jgi:hypothetical protein